jgi:predicted glycosyltransferase
MFTQTTETSSPRIITYSQDGLGLGHMRRTHSIVSQLLKLRPETSVLTLSDSPLGQFFTPAPNHDYLKLPSIVKDGPGKWRASNLTMPFEAVSALRQEIIYQTVMNFRPHILFVDHMPHGAMGELLPTLAALRKGGAYTQIVLGLRDILDAPQVVQTRWQVEGAYDAIEAYYDQVLVYGMRELFDLAEQYRFSPTVADRLHYCGYVTPPPQRYATAALRAKLLPRNSHAKLIVAMAGGGADAYPMMRSLLDAMPLIGQSQRAVAVLITGPFMPAEQRQDLQTRACGLPVRILTAVDDPHRYLQAADLVVAMAGYNTSVEILQSGKRALIIPRRGPSAEQRTRTRLFAARGWVDMVDPDDLSVETVAAAVIRNLHQGPTIAAPDRPDLDGVHVAAQQLLSLLPQPAPQLTTPAPIRVRASRQAVFA